MSRRTIIVGGGGFGRELVSWALDCAEAGRIAPLAGIIDDDPALAGDARLGVAFLGPVSDFTPGEGDRLIMAIGAPETKKRVAELLTGRGGQFEMLIHPSAVTARTAELAEGVVLCPLSLVSAHAKLGRLVIVNALSSVGHDVEIGEYSTLSAHVDLTGGVVLADRVLVGSGAKVVPGVRVGAAAMLGAGATVYRNVAAGATAYAAPAKTIRPRD